MVVDDRQTAFEAFVLESEPTLRRALVGHLGPDRAGDALAEAFLFAWERWEQVQTMANATGYLFRVAQSRSRRRRAGHLESMVSATGEVEPALATAMRSLTTRQRSVVWLVCACQWTHQETAIALGISPSAVATHLSRAMAHLRLQLGVTIGR